MATLERGSGLDQLESYSVGTVKLTLNDNAAARAAVG